MYQEFRASVESYVDRRLDAQAEIGREYDDAISSGSPKGKKGKADMSEEAFLRMAGKGEEPSTKEDDDDKGGPTG